MCRRSAVGKRWMRGVQSGGRSLPFWAVWELIRPRWGGWGELMILAGWGGIPDLGSCPWGIAVMWQLFVDIINDLKTSSVWSVSWDFPFRLLSPPLQTPVRCNDLDMSSFLLVICKTARAMLQTDCNALAFSPCLQEADSVPGPDLCPAAGRSRLPVDPAEGKSDELTSTQVAARRQHKCLRSESTPEVTRHWLSNRLLHMIGPPCTARTSFHGTKLLRLLMYFFIIVWYASKKLQKWN